MKKILFLLLLFTQSFLTASHWKKVTSTNESIKKLLNLEYSWPAEQYLCCLDNLITLNSYQKIITDPDIHNPQILLDNGPLLTQFAEAYKDAFEFVKIISSNREDGRIFFCLLDTFGIRLPALKKFYDTLTQTKQRYEAELERIITAKQQKSQTLKDIKEALECYKELEAHPEQREKIKKRLTAFAITHAHDEDVKKFFEHTDGTESDISITLNAGIVNAKQLEQKVKVVEKKSAAIVDRIELKKAILFNLARDLLKQDPALQLLEMKTMAQLAAEQLKYLADLNKVIKLDKDSFPQYFEAVNKSLLDCYQRVEKKQQQEQEKLCLELIKQEEEKRKQTRAPTSAEAADSAKATTAKPAGKPPEAQKKEVPSIIAESLMEEPNPIPVPSPEKPEPFKVLLGAERAVASSDITARWIHTEADKHIAIRSNFFIGTEFSTNDHEHSLLALGPNKKVTIITREAWVYKLFTAPTDISASSTKYALHTQEKKTSYYEHHTNIFDYLHHNFPAPVNKLWRYGYVVKTNPENNCSMRIFIPGELRYLCSVNNTKQVTLREVGCFEIFIENSVITHSCFRNIPQYTKEASYSPDSAKLVTAIESYLLQENIKPTVDRLMQQRLVIFN